MKGFALVSVYDKSFLTSFVRSLVELGYPVLSTGGTAQFLSSEGIDVVHLESYISQPELLDGRVKTLHPKVHAGILARRDNPSDMSQLASQQVTPVDLVLVNLYPFTQKVKEIQQSSVRDHGSLIESIDIGGPTMLRAAAKNCRFVIPLCDPADYERVLAELRTPGGVSYQTRQYLAEKVYRTMAVYDGAVARYFSLKERLVDADGVTRLAPVESFTLERKLPLRYGENAHQQAALYRRASVEGVAEKHPWEQLQGKELSYNNILDLHAALDLFLEVVSRFPREAAAVIIKHTNPCGVALAPRNVAAFQAARSCDPLSAFGGIVAVSGTLTDALAAIILEGFVELVLAYDITPEAEEVFARKKNVRLIRLDPGAARKPGELSVRNFAGDYLLQTQDDVCKNLNEASLAAGTAPSQQLLRDLELAWVVSKHVKSNAIVIARDGKIIGVGAGQMSRYDSGKIAIDRARFHGHSLNGASSASDAFFPFPDTLELLHAAGVTSVVQPGGSIKDEEVIKSAKDRGMTMLFTGERHFRH